MKKYWQNRKNNNKDAEKRSDNMDNNQEAYTLEEEQQTREEEGFDEIETREEEIENLRRELEEEKQRHLRTRADLENFRKRMERELETQRVNAKKEILLDLLTFLDYFDQAKKQVKDTAASEGLEIMSRQFNDLLHRHGVRPVECLGEPFDPEEQEGIGYLGTDQFDEGCVCEEISPGYKLGDILLKPARVMVARKPEGEETDTDPDGNEEENPEIDEQ